ncbi:fasciclin domain-containing protein [Qipengyuania sp. JC766]|uniref:fasciclin domain-containing protein n=1 Tax=Qipengyuania sp. JC766 TaxID=3232139 RepID=UPI00345753F1
MNLRSIAAISALALATAACTTMDDGMADSMDDDMATETSTQTTASTSTTASIPVVGGAQMLPSRNIVQNASEASNLTTLVSLVQAADLAQALQGPGPFTVFAPTNAAFQKVPAATVQSLQQPENQQMLQGVLTYHVVSGNVDAAALNSLIENGGGTATLPTVSGGNLTFRKQGNNIVVMGQNGSMGTVTQANVRQSNGVVHVIDGVLMPAM